MLAALDRLRLFNFREFAVHWGRSIASIAVIAVSSALLVGVLGVSGSIVGSVERLSTAVAGNADLEVAGVTEGGFDQSVLEQVAAAPGVEAAVPLLRMQFGRGDDRFTLIGADVSATKLDSDLRSAVTGNVGFDPTGVVVGPAFGAERGATVTLGSQDVRVSGVASGAAADRINGGHFVVAPLGLAQRIADRPQKLDSIVVIAAPGADLDAVRDAVTSAVAGRALVADPDFRSVQAANSIVLMKYSLILTASIALIVAAFLVFNAMNMTVVRRRPIISTQRALGGKRSGIVADLLVEATLVGLLGALIGVPLGLLMGKLAIGSLPPVVLQSFDARVDYIPPTYGIGVAVGACVLASVVASIAAARQVYRVEPIEALAPVPASTMERTRMSVQVVVAAISAVLVGVALVVALRVDSRIALAAVVLFFLGTFGFCFVATRPIVAATSKAAALFGAPGRLSAESIERAPRRVWATVMTGATVVAMVVSVTGSNDDLIESGTQWFATVADTDLFVSSTPPESTPTGVILPMDLEATVAAVPGVARVVPAQATYAAVGDDRIIVQGLAPGANDLLDQSASQATKEAVVAGKGVVVSRDIGRSMNLHVGDMLELQTSAGVKQIEVLELVDYLSLLGGAIGIGLPLLREWFDRPGSTWLEVDFLPGSDAAAVRAAVQAAIPDDVYAYSGTEFLDAGTQSLTQGAALSQALTWIIALVGAIALLNTLMLSVLERRRELGVLRAMGSSRRFTSLTILAEAGAIGIVGGLLGLLLGSVTHFVASTAFTAIATIDVEYRFSPAQVVFALAALAVSMLGSIPPALHAGRLNIIEAVAAE